jgi:hypothetical protein
VFENRVLRGIRVFGPKMENITGGFIIRTDRQIILE